jgi:hypothetical protein
MGRERQGIVNAMHASKQASLHPTANQVLMGEKQISTLP